MSGSCTELPPATDASPATAAKIKQPDPAATQRNRLNIGDICTHSRPGILSIRGNCAIPANLLKTIKIMNLKDWRLYPIELAILQVDGQNGAAFRLRRFSFEFLYLEW